MYEILHHLWNKETKLTEQLKEDNLKVFGISDMKKKLKISGN